MVVIFTNKEINYLVVSLFSNLVQPHSNLYFVVLGSLTALITLFLG